MRAKEILETAADLVSGDRNRQHGDKHRNFANIAILVNAYLAIRANPGDPLTGADIARIMALLKIARTQSGEYNEDNYLDSAGYLAIAGELEGERGGAGDR